MKRFWVVYGTVFILIIIALAVNYKCCTVAVCDSNGKMILPFENGMPGVFLDYNDNLKIKNYFRINNFKKTIYSSEGKYLFSSFKKFGLGGKYYGDICLTEDIVKNKAYLFDKKGNKLVSARTIIYKKNNIFEVQDNNSAVNFYDAKKKKMIFTNNDYTSLTTHESYITMSKNDRYGLYDFEGNEILPCNNMHNIISKVGDIFVFLCKDGLCGVCDKNDRELVKPEYNKFFIVNDKLYLSKNENFLGYMNCTPNINYYKSFIYEKGKLKEIDYSVWDCDQNFHVEAWRYLLIEKNEKRGVWNRKGEEILPPVYDYIMTFPNKNIFKIGKSVMPEKMYYSYNSKTGDYTEPCYVSTYKFGAADEKGKEIVPCKYDDIIPLSEGFVMGRNNIHDNNFYCDIYDKSGKKIIGKKYTGTVFVKNNKIIMDGIYDGNGKLLVDKPYHATNIERDKNLISLNIGQERINSIFVDLETMKFYNTENDYIIEKNPQLKNEKFIITNGMIRSYILVNYSIKNLWRKK